MAVAALPRPPQLPTWLEIVLWAILACWIVYLGRWGSGIGSGGLAMSLCVASFPLTGAVVAATNAWPQPQAASFIHLIAWMAFAIGLSGVVMWLNHRSDDAGPDEGDDEERPEPDPPWWPDFERDFRSWASRPKPPARHREPTPTR
jgi:hypothetical protein